jgi:hypothetical protein
VKGIRRNASEGTCPSCFSEEDDKQILLNCLEIRNWRTEFLNEKRFNMNKEELTG